MKSKIKVTGKTPADGKIKDVKLAAPLKYLSNFWRSLEMLLINCEINVILTFSAGCVIFSVTGAKQFIKLYTKTDTKK